MIKEMLIHNIAFEDDSCGEYWVDAETLEYMFPSEYNKTMSENEYFTLALKYLELYVGDVENVDYAKIDYWR
jgi:hypothetical protein